jgi:hypothetical protein
MTMSAIRPTLWKTLLLAALIFGLAFAGPWAGWPGDAEAARFEQWVGAGTAGVAAQQEQPAGVAELTLERLGGSDFVMRPRYSQHGMTFALPYRWRIVPGASFLELHYDLITEDRATAGLPEVEAGVLEIYLDGELVGSLIPRGGPGQSVRLALPPVAFGDAASNEHSLAVTYTSRVRCGIDDVDPARVILRDDSFFHVEYVVAPLQIDLAQFPRPLYQELVGPELAVIVIPDGYDDADLEAAASIAATIGGSTFGGVEVAIRRASEATAELLADSDAILVGRAERHTMITDLYKKGLLPTVLDKDGKISVRATGETAAPEDGVLQEIRSPNSEDHVYLIVTGTSSDAVLRAARALSSLDPRFALRGSFAIVSEVGEAQPPSLPTEVTLAQLGLREATLYGSGSGAARVRFFLGSGWVFEKNPVLKLSYRHSASLNTGASNLTILLNDNPIGSAALVGGNERTQELDLDLPIEDLEPGRNWLSFEALLELQDPCADPATTAAWARILGTSTLQIPYQVAGQPRIDVLANPIEPFASAFDLGDTWFVLPKEPNTRELDGLAEAAWTLGETTNGAGFAPRVTRGTSLGQIEKGYNVLAIGRPTANALIAEVNDELYQPFAEGTDALEQRIGNVTYHLPKDFSVGLIQLVRAPWDPQRALTVVTGTTDEGVRWALDALKTGEAFTNLTVVGINGIEALDGEDMLRGTLQAMEAVTDRGLVLETAETSPAATGVSQPTPQAGTGGGSDYTQQSSGAGGMLFISALLVGLGILTIGVATVIRRRRSL